MTQITANGIRICYTDRGSGNGPPLLFIHGHPFDRSMWNPQLDAFASSSQRVIAPDLRGYGDSEIVPGQTELGLFVADLVALLEALEVSGPVIVCGLSMGGQIAMEFCRQHPDRVAGLALCATYPRADTEDYKRVRNEQADMLLREGFAQHASDLLPKMVGAKSIRSMPHVATQVLHMMLNAYPEGAAAALRGRALRPAYEPTLGGLAVPALVVAGDADAYTTREDAEGMHKFLKGSELLWLNDCGHMPNLERTAEFNAALTRLIESAHRPG